MPCFHPVDAWRDKIGPNSETGKWPLTFNPDYAWIGPDGPEYVPVPCGQCSGCRQRRAQAWAVRCYHETLTTPLYDANGVRCGDNACFITLTYARCNPARSLNHDHFQRFMKRLNKRFGPGLRFYMCGEYGEKNARPHYHALVWGVNFLLDPDKRPVYVNPKTKDVTYQSPLLDREWIGCTETGQPSYNAPRIHADGSVSGFCSVGAATYLSAGYVARYVMKKQTGKNSSAHYQWVDPDTGEIHERLPEYNQMSRRDAIGRKWAEANLSEIYPDDCCTVPTFKGTARVSVPRYYDALLEKVEPETFSETKERRIEAALAFEHNQTPERLAVRERCNDAKLKLLPRNL